ncbi:hypothetical protein SAMD00019534_026110 [Acytostelium subglobosum LB1]|uniref:hypothetical protein n=1 Tax=Acytostelium subglobosum LB1 TaxID=1410327 RepID=UPI0006450953|nr:hypothetical protein SAMD00019534_026110 [Acytostelium subglobosum LB1]GAM19436.1 hypothetical protein SAMD00019534_026110 [Acytostelium subglobosum LB1]|eukprot:XP_012757363.1 hypothetical protein SAMD00019534_026110 [Acytostelium subglobosum LB1]
MNFKDDDHHHDQNDNNNNNNNNSDADDDVASDIDDNALLDETDVNNTLTEQDKDDLLYDELEDDKNQQWVDTHLNRSNAYLSCPCCFTLLCADCQRHDRYKNQYRAMFVKNCKVDFTSRLVHKEEVKSHHDAKNNRSSDIHEQEEEEEVDVIEEHYNPVRCAVCDTQVAVYDKDEVYHFFNVFPSNS